MNALAADAQEGMCAFVEKRKPVWSGHAEHRDADCDRSGRVDQSAICNLSLQSA